MKVETNSCVENIIFDKTIQARGNRVEGECGGCIEGPESPPQN